MQQPHQAKVMAQLEELLESVCTGPLPVADRLEFWRLEDPSDAAGRISRLC